MIVCQCLTLYVYIVYMYICICIYNIYIGCWTESQRLDVGDWRLEIGRWRLEIGDWRLERRDGQLVSNFVDAFFFTAFRWFDCFAPVVNSVAMCECVCVCESCE